MFQNHSSFKTSADSVSEQCGGETTSIFESRSILPETITMSLEKSNDLWGGGLFALPELGTDLQGDKHTNAVNTEKNCNKGNDNFQNTYFPVDSLTLMVGGNENPMGVLSESKKFSGHTQNQNLLSSNFSTKKHQYQQEQFAMTLEKKDAANSLMTSSVGYVSQANQPNLSFLSVGGAAMSPNCNNNNNIVCQQTSSGPSALSGSASTILTTSQGGNNFVMLAPPLSAQQFCIPTAAHTMVPCYVVAPSQQVVDVNETVAYPSLTPGPQAIVTVMCGQWNPAVVSTMGNQPSTPAAVSTALSAMPQTFAATGSTTSPQPAVSMSPGENTQSTGTLPSIAVCGDGGPINQKQAPKGSPPSYDSIRQQFTRRRQQQGRQRSGTNVHGRLQGGCAYYSYNLSAAFKQYQQPDSGLTKTGEQVLPIFIQMFPCELRDRTVIVLNRVIEATCNKDVATVVGIEPRSETSFIALVRTNRVWHLIHQLRCRVLMDRHGFWYAENMDHYMRLKEYCEGVRRLPQQMRHMQTDGLPCMPLVVELSRSVDAKAVTSPSAPPPFDDVVPIVTVERHTRSGNNNNKERNLTMDEESEEARSSGDLLGNLCS